MTSNPQDTAGQITRPDASGPSEVPVHCSPREIMRIIEDLTSLMSEEVRLLRAMQVREFSALQKRKLALTRDYEVQTKVLREDRAFAASLGPRIRGEMRDLMERLHAIMDDNAAAILAAQEMNHRVARAIVAAVQEQKPENSIYSAAGGLSKSKAAPPVSLQFDQSL